MSTEPQDRNVPPAFDFTVSIIRWPTSSISLPLQEVEMTEHVIQTEMESVAHLDVPLVLDVGIGYNWEEAH